MIKRIICFLIVICCLIASISQAEDKITTISFTVMNDGKDFCFQSSLSPNETMKITSPDGIDSSVILSVLEPDLLAHLMNSFRETLFYWEKKNNHQKGIYTGDLFERAYDKETIELNSKDRDLFLSDFIRCFSDKSPFASIPEASAVSTLDSCFNSIINHFCSNDTTIYINTYNKDQYITLNLMNGYETIMTLSADLSNKEEGCLVIGRGNGNVSYFEEVVYTSHGTETDYVISLFRTKASSFRMVMEQDCIQYGELQIKQSGIGAFDIEGDIHSILLNSAVHVKGSKRIEEDGKDRLNIDLTHEGQPEIFTEVLFSILNSFFQE